MKKLQLIKLIVETMKNRYIVCGCTCEDKKMCVPDCLAEIDKTFESCLETIYTLDGLIPEKTLERLKRYNLDLCSKAVNAIY